MRLAPPTLTATVAALTLTGCVSLHRSEPIGAIGTADARGVRISTITVTRADGVNVTPQFDDIFRREVARQLARCTSGDQPARLEARIDRLTKANPVMTAVVGGANVLRGTARLVDEGTGRTLGEYRIGRTVVGGRLAVIRMGEAEEQMSQGFGQELCAQAFAPPTPPSRR